MSTFCPPLVHSRGVYSSRHDQEAAERDHAHPRRELPRVVPAGRHAPPTWPRTRAVRGCMVIKPWGYALWENIQRVLDGMFKATGHENAYFPLFIPLSASSRRRPSTSRASPRSARWSRTTGSRPAPTASSCPTGKLEEPLVVRPTSRDDHRRDVREVGAELSRPAAAHQPVGQRRALGDAHAAVPAHDRVPLAGGPHRARDRARRPSKRRMQMLDVYADVRRGVHGDARDPGREDRGRAVPRRGATRTASRR